MGNKVWYLDESDEPYSSYTDLTGMNEDNTVIVSSKVPKKKAAVKPIRNCKKKNRKTGKVLLCLVGALAISMTSISGTWFYLTEIKDGDYEVDSNLIEDANDRIGELFSDNDDEPESCEEKKFSKKKNNNDNDIDYSDPVYEIAEDILSGLWCGDDLNTSWAIFNWVHSNINYQTLNEELSYEEAAYRGFTRKTGDCYVYFSCAKMLLDCAGIPNLMVERYPVITNGHYWNLVQIDGLWYHCDATVFRDHPDMYFMLTDDEICDEHHQFDGSLYPERAESYYDYYADDYYWDYDSDYYYDPYVDSGDCYEDYYDDYYYWDENSDYIYDTYSDYFYN